MFEQDYGDGLYQNLANRLFSGTRLKKGEYHVPQLTLKGIQNAKFEGPGSDIKYRLHQKGISQADNQSKLHDIQYSLRNDKKDIRKADIHMLKGLVKKAALSLNPLEKINNSIAFLGISTKIALESLHIIDRDKFSGKESLLTDFERSEFEREEKSLLDQGYGIHKILKHKKRK